jgi:hypothetical protein
VLLNNDAVVTDGWLDQLIALTRVSAAETKTEPPEGDGQEDRIESDSVVLTILDYRAETAEAAPLSPPLAPP